MSGHPNPSKSGEVIDAPFQEGDSIDFTTLPPLSLYIHYPWCLRKCPYCDFNSHPVPPELANAESQYLRALLQDLEQEIPFAQRRKLASIFFGGGTPSLLSAGAAKNLLQTIEKKLGSLQEIEITLEANPGTFEAEKFSAFRTAGINRLSIGVQSFDEKMLKKLGRIHSPTQAIDAINHARDAGFDSFNIDLMYGLPDQTSAMLQYDLEKVLSLDPPHLSFYQLTIEPNTQFYSHPPNLPEEDLILDMQEQLETRLNGQGYQNYEISAWAKPGHQSQHNRNYWQFGDYLGIGAGAHSKISESIKPGTPGKPDRIFRRQKYRMPETYMSHAAQGNPVCKTDDLNAEDLLLEFMMNALRLTEGFTLELFQQRTGLPVTLALAPLQLAKQQGFITLDGDQIKPSLLGRQFLNDLLLLFYPEH